MTRRREGFALLTVLWLVLLLGTLVMVGAAPIVLAQRAQANGLYLTRARWAALACLELTRAHVANGQEAWSSDSIRLGGAVTCSWDSLNPDERVNPNLADSVGLYRVLGDTDLVASVLDWIDGDDSARRGGAESDWYRSRSRPVPRNGPITDARELSLVRGLETLATPDVERVFTARGDGSVTPNRAPEWALSSVSILSAHDVARIVELRDAGIRFESAEQLVAVADVNLTIPQFAELTHRLSFADSRRTLRFHGRADAGDRVLQFSMVAELVESGGEIRIATIEIES